MEFVEPKRGDKVFDNNRIVAIQGFDEDSGTHLGNGRWISINEYEKDADGVWVKKGTAKTFAIGETYSDRHASHAGTRVIRPAVYLGGSTEKIATTSPCCTLVSRRLDFADLTSELARAQGGWTEVCTGCGWYYRVSVVHTGQDARLGLYGVCWESSGHGKKR